MSTRRKPPKRNAGNRRRHRGAATQTGGGPTLRPEDVLGNFLPALLRFREAAQVPPGSHLRVTVLHDPWCRFTSGRGPCNCDPEIRAGLPGCHDIH